MAKILFSILAVVFLLVASARADYFQSPFVLLGIPNSWTATQTFKDIIVTGTCTGCGSGGSGQNYPDWTISGSQNINSATSNSVTVAELNVQGDVYIFNLYTDPQ